MKKILILLACLLPMLKGMAYDFKVNDIYYRIFATETGIEAEVTYNNDNYNSYSGEVVIPGNITHGEKSYKVIMHLKIALILHLSLLVRI